MNKDEIDERGNISTIEHLKMTYKDTDQVIMNRRMTDKTNNLSFGHDNFHGTNISLKVTGHCLIRDKDTKEVLTDKMNAIHFENFSELIAFGIADRPNGHIHQMVFGDGGSIVNSVNTIQYFPPNTTGPDAQLYSQTYAKVVDDLSPLNLDPANNKLQVQHTINTSFSDVIVTCTLDYSEPAGQSAFDNSPTVTGTYIFDEIGLKNFDPISGNGNLLTHVIFSPIQKSLNRSLEIIYTIRIVMV